MPKPTCQTSLPIHRGYIEGYYGQLLGWQERAGLIDHLAALSCDAYLYAPKEDIYHRWQWRTPYPPEFLASFHELAEHAKSAGIHLLAGIAPGLDFDFTRPDSDTNALFAKAAQLLAAGADAIVLMFDDISDDITALKRLACLKGYVMPGWPMICKPVLAVLSCWYRASLFRRDTRRSSAYGTALDRHLSADISVLLCGKTIIAKQVNLHGQAGQIGNMLARPVVIWDIYIAMIIARAACFLPPMTAGTKPIPSC